MVMPAFEDGPDLDDLSKFDTQPNGKQQRPKSETLKGATVRRGPIAKGMTKFYANIGGIVTLACPDCGVSIVSQAEKLGDNWEELAKQNEAVKRTLEGMLEKSAAGIVIAQHLALMGGIVVHHSKRVQDAIERIHEARTDTDSETTGDPTVYAMGGFPPP